MADFPTVVEHGHVVISTFHPECAGDMAFYGTTVGATVVWPAANVALFFPLRLAYPLLVAKMFWENGSTVGTDNVDVGIYDAEGNRLVSSGSTLTAGGSAIQTVDLTDTTLKPGLYYMAMARDATTDTFEGSAVGSPLPLPRSVGILEATSAFPLPSTATMVGSTRSTIIVLSLTGKAVI